MRGHLRDEPDRGGAMQHARRNAATEWGVRRALLRTRARDALLRHGGAGHMSTPFASMSRAVPNGEEAMPRGSRSKALRMTSTGAPNCSAMLATTALSRAAASLWLPALPFDRKISAIEPSGNRETVAV